MKRADDCKPAIVPRLTSDPDYAGSPATPAGEPFSEQRGEARVHTATSRNRMPYNFLDFCWFIRSRTEVDIQLDYHGVAWLE